MARGRGDHSSHDVAALAQRYHEERLRRLNSGAQNRQYRPWNDDNADLLDDPFRTKRIKRKPVSEECEVLIVGGGYGGLIMAVELLQAGIENFRIVEKAGDFGGTWYWCASRRKTTRIIRRPVSDRS